MLKKSKKCQTNINQKVTKKVIKKKAFLIVVGSWTNGKYINVEKLTVKNIYIHFVLNSKFDHSSKFKRSKNLRA